MSRQSKTTAAKAGKTTAKAVNKVVDAGEVNTSPVETLSLTERITKRLVEQIHVRHMNPSVCVLTLDRNKGKMGEKVFQGYQERLITIGELIEIAPNTKLFTGEDGHGTNAALYIEDAEVREYLGFGGYDENGDYVDQIVLTEERVLEILNEKNKKKFEQEIEGFRGDITKVNLIRDTIRRTKFNDAQRIKYIEKELDIEITF